RELSSPQLSKLLQSKSKTYDRLIENNIKIYPGVEEFIKNVANHYRVAIGSGALKKEISHILEVLSLGE
ncbi:MAG: hypothetical protein GTO02_16145, partial [Candidatus Dadabacteria bacterium]|nr:hypothetical protein [Candidatus Dadabacteria bacterium]NIQ15862.1 hypothetical protein [Candidatus Dadabacteria bacterium]